VNYWLCNNEIVHFFEGILSVSASHLLEADKAFFFRFPSPR
jgi:hypothetical protein